LVSAVNDSLVEQVNADSVTAVLETGFSLVAGNSVSFFALNLDSLVDSHTAIVFNAGKLVLLADSDIGFFSHFMGELDAVLVSILDGSLSSAVHLNDLLLVVLALVKFVFSVLDLFVDLDSVVSPGDGVLVTANLKLLAPCSQQGEESSPLGVALHVLDEAHPVEDILVHSEVSSDAVVEVLAGGEPHGCGLNSFSNDTVGVEAVTEVASIVVFDVVGLVKSGGLVSVVVPARRYFVHVVADFEELSFSHGIGASVDEHAHDLVGIFVSSLQWNDILSVSVVQLDPG